MTESALHRRPRLEAVLAAGLAAGIGWSLYRQGIDLGNDGAWLLGSSRLLHGARLYRDFEPGDGPFRYWMLAPFLGLNSKAAALALLRTCSLAVASGVGVFWLSRRGMGLVRWLWPLALIALGPLDPGAALVLGAVGLTFSRWRFSIPALALLLGLSLTADPRVTVSVALLGLAAPLARRDRGHGHAPAVPLALAVAGAICLWMAGASGPWSAALRNTLVHPWWRLAEHFGEGNALRWWSTLVHGGWVHIPFAEVSTGENLTNLGPLHTFLHRWSYRLLALLAFGLGPCLALVLRAKRRLWVPVLAGGLVAAWWLVAGGDVPSMKVAGLVLVGVVLLVGTETAGHPTLRLAGLALVAGTFTLGAEQIWLSTQLRRPELQNFSRGGVLLSTERAQRLEEFFSRLTPALSSPLVIWPDQAGLYFLYDIEPAVPQLGMRGLHLAPGTRSESLLRADPQVVLLAQNWNATAQVFRRYDAPLWSALRQRYRLAGWLRGRTDRIRLLVRMKEDESLATLPLAQRLPLLELTVSNDVSPALRQDLTVGQSFFTEDDDLSGVVFRWKTAGKDLKFDVKVRVWQRLGTEFDTLLSSTRVRIEVPGDGARTYLRLDVPETAHKELAVTLELVDDMPDEVRLYWHRHDVGGQEVDLFRGGSALLDLHETPADLYFLAY